LAGSAVQCPKCGAGFTVPAAPPPAPEAPAPNFFQSGQSAGPALQVNTVQSGEPVFHNDKFLLRQKHLSISEKYHVLDQFGTDILFMERPRFLFNRLMAASAGLLTGLGALYLLGYEFPVYAYMGGYLFKFAAFPFGGVGSAPKLLALLIFVPPLVLTVALMYFTAAALCKKKHVTIYRDDTRSEVLLRVFQHNKIQLLKATFVVTTPEREELAWLEKKLVRSILRKQWDCYTDEGAPLAVIKEDSIILSLLRRLMRGSFFGLLRTNFIFLTPDEETVFGEFNRAYTILDRYVLDLSGDPDRKFDRRIALAMGVLLDTAEGR
jgi:uncharacterized protein YxjI